MQLDQETTIELDDVVTDKGHTLLKGGTYVLAHTVPSGAAPDPEIVKEFYDCTEKDKKFGLFASAFKSDRFFLVSTGGKKRVLLGKYRQFIKDTRSNTDANAVPKDVDVDPLPYLDLSIGDTWRVTDPLCKAVRIVGMRGNEVRCSYIFRENASTGQFITKLAFKKWLNKSGATMLSDQ